MAIGSLSIVGGLGGVVSIRATLAAAAQRVENRMTRDTKATSTSAEASETERRQRLPEALSASGGGQSDPPETGQASTGRSPSGADFFARLVGAKDKTAALREMLDSTVDAVNKLPSQATHIAAGALPSEQPPKEKGADAGDTADTSELESRLATARDAALKFIDTLDRMGRMGHCWPTPLTPRYIINFQRLRGELVMQAHNLDVALKPVDDELTETAAKIHSGALSACGRSGTNAHATADAIAERVFYDLGIALGWKEAAGDPIRAYKQPLSDENRSLVEGALSLLKHEELQLLKADVLMESKLTSKRLREELLRRHPGSSTGSAVKSEGRAGDDEEIEENPAEPRQDGPEAPDSFWWKERQHDGLRPNVFRLVRLLWDAPSRKVSFEEVEDDWGRTVTDKTIYNASSDLSCWFEKAAIPLDCRTKNQLVLLEE